MTSKPYDLQAMTMRELCALVVTRPDLIKMIDAEIERREICAATY